MDKIDKGEIVYADLILKDKNQCIYNLKKVVFSRDWKCDFPVLKKDVYKRFLKQHNIPIDVEVVELNIHERTGFKHQNKNYTNVKKNNQVRDSITGAYV